MSQFNELNKQNERAKQYLEYIDKEMTFTGIITTFSIGCLLFMADKLFSKDVTLPNLKDYTSLYFLIPLLYLAISAGLLLIHRSRLAFHYGMISLELFSPKFSGQTIVYWFDVVDDWKFWNKYLYALAFIVTAFTSLAVFVLIKLFPNNSFFIFLNHYQTQIIIVGTIIAALIEEKLIIPYLKTRFPQDERVVPAIYIEE